MSIDAPDELDFSRPRSRSRRRRRRRPAPPAAFGWRWLYPVGLVALAVLALFLSATGARLVLDSRDGTVDRAELDPTKPGYEVAVPPTPTMLVVQADADGGLFGAMVLSLAADDAGGWAVVLPSTLRVELPDGEVLDLDDAFAKYGVADAATGKGVRAAVSLLFGADVDAVVTLDATSLAPLIEPVAPLDLDLDRAVRTRGGSTLLPAGEVEISTADEVSAATEVLGRDDGPLDRAERQVLFWQAWIEAVTSSPDPETAFPPFTAGSDGAGMARFVRGLAAGESTVDVVPFVEFLGAIVAEEAALQDLAVEMIPFPQQPGVRVPVAVRNGVGDGSLDDPMLTLLVASGAQIVSRGNAESFDVATTSVAYHDPAAEDRAEELAQDIGATEVRFVAIPESQFAATVTIGRDFVP